MNRAANPHGQADSEAAAAEPRGGVDARGPRRGPARPGPSALVRLAALTTFGSGVLTLISLAGRALPARAALLRAVFPLEFLRLSRLVTFVVGYALVLASISLYRRKRRAWGVAVALSVCSIVFHLTKGIDYEEAAFSLVLLGLLIVTRGEFVVDSGPPDWRSALTRLGVSAAVAGGYGLAGYWLLDLRAAWFRDSVDLLAIAGLLYVGYTLFSPTLYRLRTLSRERALAADILNRHGRSALDYFKIWPDKSLFFSASRRSFLAYRAERAVALVLADPVGPDDDLPEIIGQFAAFCDRQDWTPAFYQTLPDLLPVYREHGFRKLKIGDDAIVDLRGFTLDGSARKTLRHAVRKIEAAGVQSRWHDAPIPDTLLEELREVSAEWLRIPGRRERQFAVGRFDPTYVRSTPVFLAEDADGRVLAFANIVPSYRPGEATIDLMRRRTSAPNGTMDYLLVTLMLFMRDRGYERFNLGMAPMAGFADEERASAEERALHLFVRQLDFIFSYRGLHAYKAKFATTWEPRYLVFRHAVDLPRIALALARVSQIEPPVARLTRAEG